MRSTAKPATYTDFSGGLNAQAAPYLLEVSQARDCLNVHTTPTGAIKKRNGFVAFSDTTLYDATRTLGGVHSLYPANTSTKSLLAAGVIEAGTSDSIVKISTGGVAANLKTGLTANLRWNWAQAEVSGASGPLYGLNGTDTPQRWDGSAASTSDWVATTGTVPNGKFISFQGSRLWIAGVAATPSRLYYSGITGTAPDPLNWDANNYVDVEPNDGESITGIGMQGPNLVVFKPRKTFIVYDLVTGAFRQLSDEVGCVAHRTIIDTPAGTFFLSEDQGVCITDGSTIKTEITNAISDPVKPVFDDVRVNPQLMPNACAAYRDNRYYLSISVAGTRNDAILEFDLSSESWWLHDCKSNQFALLDPGGTATLYSASPATGADTAHVDKAFVADIYQDYGANYTGTAYFTTAYFVWGAPHVQKRLRQIRVDGVGQWQTEMTTDFADNFATLDGELWDGTEPTSSTTFGGTGSYGGTGTFGPASAAYFDRRYYTPGVGRSFAVKFINDDPNDFQIYSATFALTARTD